MSILFVLIPLGLVLLAIAVWGFVWAVDHGQFEDLDRAASSILFEDEPQGIGAARARETKAEPAATNEAEPLEHV